MTLRCVICTGEAQESRGLLEEQLTVFYFLKKFLKYSFFPENVNSYSCESLLTNQGNPTEWISFCSLCLEWITKAQKINFEITKLESQIETLRTKVQNKLKDSFHLEESIDCNNVDIFKSVRCTIYNSKDLFNDVTVKLETSLEDFEWPTTPTIPFEEDTDEDLLSCTRSRIQDLIIVPSTQFKTDNDFVFEPQEIERFASDVSKPKILGRPKSRIELRTCPVCKELFDRPSFMTRHLKAFHSGHVFSRNQNDSIEPSLLQQRDLTENSQVFVKVIRKKSRIESRRCPICKKIWDTPSLMIRHLNTRHQCKGPFTCPTCEIVIKRKDHFYIHKQTHYNITKVEPKFSSKDLFDEYSQSLEELKDNETDQTDENDSESDDKKIEIEPLLNKSISIFKTDLLKDCNHLMMNESEPKINNEDDNESPSDLEVKGNRKTGRRKSSLKLRTCPICKRICKTPSVMIRHVNIRHQSKGPFTCPECHIVFNRKDLFFDHKKIHPELMAKEVKQIMKDGGISFEKAEFEEAEETSTDGLKVGRKKSTLQSRTCPVCNKVCTNPSVMQRHLNIRHQRRGPFTCPVCQLVINRKDLFYLHKKTHERIKVKSVINSSMSSMNNSINANPVKPHSFGGKRKSCIKSRTCPICNRTFDRPSQMIRHVHSVHHRKGPFICPALGCGMKFTRKDYFFNHKKTHPTFKSKLGPNLEEMNMRKYNEKSNKESDRSKRLQRRQVQKNDTPNNFLDKKEEDEENEQTSNEETDGNYSDEEKGKKKSLKRKTNKKLIGHINGGRRKSSLELRTCPICKEVFSKPSSMNIHLTILHDKKPLYNCQLCQKGFPMKAYLESHMWTHLSEEERLKRCSKIRKKRSHKNEDITYKSPIVSRTCPECQTIFATPSKMQMHLNTKHIRKILFTCEFCQKGFLRRDTYNNHLRTHLTPEERIMINSGKGSKDLSSNMEEGEGEILKEFGATGLFAKFSESKISDIKHRTCGVCQKIFDKPSRMLRHLNSVHTKSEMYVCEVCGKKFTWKDTLKKHMKYHEDEEFIKGAKDYLCTLCDTRFRHKYSFIRHNLCKHDEGGDLSKSFVCEVCGKTFKIRSLLNQHMKSKSHGGCGTEEPIPKKDRGPIIRRQRAGKKPIGHQIQYHPSVIPPLKTNPPEDNHISSVTNFNPINESDTTSHSHHSRGDLNSSNNPLNLNIPGGQNPLYQQLGGGGHGSYHHNLLSTHPHLQSYSNPLT